MLSFRAVVIALAFLVRLRAVIATAAFVSSVAAVRRVAIGVVAAARRM